MRIHGANVVLEAIQSTGYFAKCITNGTDVVFFPGTIQHRDIKVAGVSYEDDYRGNALAATISGGMIDVRFHAAFEDRRVEAIFRAILASPELRRLDGFGVRYQGRALVEASKQG